MLAERAFVIHVRPDVYRNREILYTSSPIDELPLDRCNRIGRTPYYLNTQLYAILTGEGMTDTGE